MIPKQLQTNSKSSPTINSSTNKNEKTVPATSLPPPSLNGKRPASSVVGKGQEN